MSRETMTSPEVEETELVENTHVVLDSQVVAIKSPKQVVQQLEEEEAGTACRKQ